MTWVKISYTKTVKGCVKMKIADEGLSLPEVEERIARGQINDFEAKYTKSTLDIFKDNLLTPFNLIIAIIGAAIALVGAYINMLFLIIIILNVAVGIVQELIAKTLVERLSLLTISDCQVIRTGQKQTIASNKIVLDDLIILEANEQITCDGMLVSGEIEVNEALLTGEIDPIIKRKNDEVLSGSFVISGQAYVRVKNVGSDNYAIKISSEAKKHKKTVSILMNSMNKALKLITFIIIPAGALLFFRSLIIDSGNLYNAVVNTSAAIIGMLPIGVILLITASLATGVIKLSRLRVLVQELHALESLSRVNLLCLDKTGTLTEGEMKVEDVIVLNEEYQREDINDIMSLLVGASQENNTTFKAIENEFGREVPKKIYSQTNFSSQRKWSSVSLTSKSTYYLGAPELLLSSNSDKIKKYLAGGKRVILLALADSINKNQELLTNLNPLAIIIIDDPIRENVEKTLQYFKDQGVGLRVISGDNPITVSTIAKKAGVVNYDKYVDLSQISDDDLTKIACEYTIFGRSNPNQKKRLIQIFKEQYTVAMTGDGVNDVLALKEADCSIALAQGSDAAKDVSQLVLLDSSFNELPKVVNEGRRVVNNITKVASVYFVKTIYSVILTILSIIIASHYPFTPIQLTLINFAIVGIPTFAITFERNSEPISQNFLTATLSRAIPNALVIIIMVAVIKILNIIGLISATHQVTMMYFSVALITYLTVFQISKPFNLFRKLLFIFSMVIFISLLFIFKDIIEIQLLSVNEMILFALIIIGGIYLISPLLRVASYVLSKIKT